MDVLRNGLSTRTLPPPCRWTGWTEPACAKLAHDLQDEQVSKLLGVISAGHVAIGHVRGSHYLRRVLHEVITFSILGEHLLESCTL